MVSNEELDCRKCSDELKEIRGCEKESSVYGMYKIGEEIYTRCPVKLITEDSMRMITLYNAYKNGILPHGQGLFNETDKFISAMNLIDREILGEMKNAKSSR